MLVAQNATLSLWKRIWNNSPPMKKRETGRWTGSAFRSSARTCQYQYRHKTAIGGISFPYGYSNRKYFGVCLYKRADADSLWVAVGGGDGSADYRTAVTLRLHKDRWGPFRYPSLKTVLKYAGQEVLTRLDIPLYTARDMRKILSGTCRLPFTALQFSLWSITFQGRE